MTSYQSSDILQRTEANSSWWEEGGGAGGVACGIKGLQLFSIT